MGACQILYEGKYSGILKPMIHYIPLKKDFSNIEEVFDKLEDLDYLRELTERAYKDIIETGRHSYKQFVAGVDNDIAERILRGPRYELFMSPVDSRRATVQTATKTEEPIIEPGQHSDPQATAPLLQQRARERFPHLYALARRLYLTSREIYHCTLNVRRKLQQRL